MTSRAWVQSWPGALALALAAVGCGGPQVRVAFLTLPQSAESKLPNACRIVSRSPISHIMRVSLTPEEDGRAARIDNAVVQVKVINETRNIELATVDIKPDGSPHEITLSGQADPGEVLSLSGSFSAEGDIGKFSQTCAVD